MAATKPDCRTCKHYYNTWDQACPKGCRVYGFKSLIIPSLVVERDTGNQCQGHELRPDVAKKRKNDLNDNSNW
jgi:hypothetical protein